MRGEETVLAPLRAALAVGGRGLHVSPAPALATMEGRDTRTLYATKI
jgi:hypothetical protein